MKKILQTTAVLLTGLLIGTSVSAQNQVNNSKVSAHLQEMVSHSVTKDGYKSVSTLATLAIPCNAPAFFERHGCRMIDSIGRIYIVSIPLGEVAALSNNDTIERLEAERMPRPQMDVTPQQVNATGLYAGTGLPQAYTGAGVVAGVIALWLQAKPDLTPAQALEVIRLTATHPDDTMSYPNNTYGYGQIDAYRGLLEVLELPVRIPELSQEQPQGVTFRVVDKHLYADFGGNVPNKMVFNIYSIDGRLMLTQSGKNPVGLSALKTGVYAVQLITDNKATTGSTLIRLQ